MENNNSNQKPAVQFEGQYDFGNETEANIYDQRSISLWFKVDDIDLNRKQVIYEEDGISQGLDIYVENGSLFFNVWNQSQGQWSGNFAASNLLESDTWHHASLVIDREQDLANNRPFTAYLDGINVDRGTDSTPERVDIGVGGLIRGEQSEPGLGDGDVGYSVQNIGVYDRALTEEEVELLVTPNLDPQVASDSTVTIENTEVIVLESRLLANDTDGNGDLLTITGVGNAVNGSVAQDSDGNITFTPEFNFSGEASFEYTVSDGSGGTATASTKIDVLAENRSVSLGNQLHSLSGGISPELPFLNGMRTAANWITQDFGVNQDSNGNFINTWNTAENDLLDLDEDGWVKSIPEPEDDPQYSSVGALLFRQQDYYLDDRYVVLYEGEGTIEYNFDAQKDNSASSPGRDVLNITPRGNGVWIRISDTDPNDTGDYIRNIRVVPEKYEDIAEQTYTPEFLDTVDSFDTLRYLDWMGTNNSTESEWSDRPTLDGSIFARDRVAIEEMVELANETQTSPWFNIPHQATDQYITNFAEYVAANLDPELEIYIEYSHEVWNPSNVQAGWIREQGEQEFSDSFVDGFGKRIDWYSMRSSKMAQIWDEVFDTDRERVIGVLGGQATNPTTIERALNYNWADDSLSNEAYGIDAIAVSPYTATYLADRDNAAEIANWTQDADGGVNKFFTELTQGGVLSNSPEGGAFAQAYDRTQTYIDIAEQENLELLTYEVGQNLPVNFGEEDNQAIKNLFDAAKTDPRMTQLAQEYFTTLSELGVDISTSFNNPNSYNQWGSWWSPNTNNLEGSDRLDTLTSLIARNSFELSPQLGTLANNLSELNVIVEGDPLEINTNYTDVNRQDSHNLEYNWGNDSSAILESRQPLDGEIGNISTSYTYDTAGIYTSTVTVTDDENLEASESLEVIVAKKSDINWRPYSTSQQIDLSEDGTVLTAVYGTEDFDVTNIDLTSIKADDDKAVLLNGDGVAILEELTDIQDINSDGLDDLLLYFDKPSLRSAVETDADSIIADEQLYLFGSNSELESGYFFGEE